MTSERDYYEVLGVSRDANEKTIKDAYHRLAMKWHPDRNKSADAESRFKEIARAYAVLSKADKRARYDAQGFEGVAHFSDEDLFRNIDLGSLFGDLGFGFGAGGDSIFGRFFGGGRPRPQRGRDLRVNLELTLQRIAEGGKEMLQFTRPTICTQCNGHGTASARPAENCSTCHGTGHQTKVSRAEQKKGQTISFQQVLTCPDCHGRGSVVEQPCKICAGDGQVNKQEKLRLDIPAGIDDGMMLRIPGHGLPGGPGLDPGDLNVMIYTMSDPRFQRRGADLWRSETVQIADAVLGTTLYVPTLDGEVEVKLPAGTQANEIVRLRGKGLPYFGNTAKGDINLRIQLQIPERLTHEERKLFEQLKALHLQQPVHRRFTRYLVTSDLHLGNRFSRSSQFTAMVKRLNKSISLVLAGDIIDTPGQSLGQDDLAALDAIQTRASHEQVIWIEGNHDRGYRPQSSEDIHFLDSYAIGKRLFITHGDTFDTVMPRNQWFVSTFRFFHNLRVRLGADPIHVADYAKKYQYLYNYLRRKVMNCAVEQGQEQNFEAVACGHVHFAEDAFDKGIRYINLGAWTESSCHCLLVDEDGMTLLTVEEAMRDSAWFTPAADKH